MIGTLKKLTLHPERPYIRGPYKQAALYLRVRIPLRLQSSKTKRDIGNKDVSKAFAAAELSETPTPPFFFFHPLA